MTGTLIYLLRRRFLPTLLVTFLCVGNVLSSDATVEIITHPDTNVTLSRNLLRSVFSMRLRTWQNGVPIQVFVLPDDMPLHGKFSKIKLNIFPYQLRSIWDRLVYSGTGQAPFTVRSEEEMRTKVATTPGAIGYLSAIMIDGSVKVAHIDE